MWSFQYSYDCRYRVADGHYHQHHHHNLLSILDHSTPHRPGKASLQAPHPVSQITRIQNHQPQHKTRQSKMQVHYTYVHTFLSPLHPYPIKSLPSIPSHSMTIILLQRRSNSLHQRIQAPHDQLFMLNLLSIVIHGDAAPSIAELLVRPVEADLVSLSGVFTVFFS